MVAGLLLTGRELAYLPSMCKEGPGLHPPALTAEKKEREVKALPDSQYSEQFCLEILSTLFPVPQKQFMGSDK